MSMTNNVKCLTSPRAVHTSVVKKSAAAIRCACERTKVLQLMGRSGEGLIPCSFSTLAIVLRATRWSRCFSAPWMRAYPQAGLAGQQHYLRGVD